MNHPLVPVRSGWESPFTARLLCFLLLLVGGCGPANPQGPGSASTSLPVALSPTDGAGLQDFIEQQRGKVVLVDFWATWCTTCLDGFPHTLALHGKYGDQGLVTASVSLDAPSEQQTALTFLEESNATIPNFIASQGDDTAAAMEDFEIGSGTLPTVKLFDREGKLRYTFGDGELVNFEEVEVAIRDLLR